MTRVGLSSSRAVFSRRAPLLWDGGSSGLPRRGENQCTQYIYYIVKSVGEDDTVTADAISVNGAAQKVGLPDVLQYKHLI